MFRIIHAFIICFFIVNMVPNESMAAWPWGAQKIELVTINGVPYSTDDFKHWWSNWKEPGMKIPAEPQDFIEWKLLAQEAESMEFNNQPAYKYKMRVFLKVRSRMFLKYDEVDSRIQISEQDIRDRYEAEYSPIWYVTILYYDSEDAAKKVYKRLSDGINTFDELQKLPITDGGPKQQKETKLIPVSLKSDTVLATIRDLSKGEVSTPQGIGSHFALIRLDNQRLPEAGEFALKKNGLHEKIRKEQQSKYTSQMIARLNEKYDVKVDEDLLEQANENLTGEILDQPLVRTNRGEIPLSPLVKDLQYDYRLLRKKNWTEEQKKNKKRGLLNGMITEYLITWEAEDRNYEEKEPFKWTYQFYSENRLIRELEGRVIRAKVSVTDKEITNYYNEHKEEYRIPDLVNYLLLQGDKDQIEKIWREVSFGQDFVNAAKKFDTTVVPYNDMRTNKIHLELAAVINTINVGEVGQPYNRKDKYYLVKLVDRQKPEYIPLPRVKSDIGDRLKKEKFTKLRKEYLKNLLALSDIIINRKKWNALRTELTN